MRKFFIGVATKDHVDMGVQEGFMQVCHGKKAQLLRLKKNDIIMYYCTSTIYGKKDNYQCITASGTVKDDKVYQFEISKDFIPWRRDVVFDKNLEPIKIKEILEDLAFIKNKNKWGVYFRPGLIEIKKEEYEIIIGKMKKIDNLNSESNENDNITEECSDDSNSSDS